MEILNNLWSKNGKFEEIKINLPKDQCLHRSMMIFRKNYSLDSFFGTFRVFIQKKSNRTYQPFFLGLKGFLAWCALYFARQPSRLLPVILFGTLDYHREIVLRSLAKLTEVEPVIGKWYCSGCQNEMLACHFTDLSSNEGICSMKRKSAK